MLDDYAALVRAERVYLVEIEGVVQGIIVLIPEPDSMLLDNVAVAPASQGLGLGRALMAFAERAAIAAGYRTIRLYTNEAMTENVALYTSHGYVQTHQGEEHGLRRVFLAKQLG